MLNSNEKAVLRAVIGNAYDASGGDFAFSDELKPYLKELSPNQIKGYLGQLEQKGWITCHGAHAVNGDSRNIVHQITIDDMDAAKVAAGWEL